MIYCSYCGTELNRRVFCNHSHAEMYNRKSKTKTPIDKENKKQTEAFNRSTNNKLNKTKDKILNAPFDFAMCNKHKVYKGTCKCK